MITPTQHEKSEWSRFAVDAYRRCDTFTGHRYSAYAALPNGTRLDVGVFDTLQRNYVEWLIGGAR